MSTGQTPTEANPETVRDRLETVLRYERDSALGFADAAVRPQDTADYRRIATILDRILDDVAAGRYAEAGPGREKNAAANPLPVRTRIEVVNHADHNGRTGIIIGHSIRDNRGAYDVTFDDRPDTAGAARTFQLFHHQAEAIGGSDPS